MKSWDCGNVSRLTFCDFQDNYGLAGFKKATSLKYKHPHLKVHNQTNILVSFFLNLKVHKQTSSFFLKFFFSPQPTPPWGDTSTQTCTLHRQILLFRSLWRSEVGTREAPSTARWQKIQKSVYSHFLSIWIWIWSRARSRSFIQIKYSLETLFSQH